MGQQRLPLASGNRHVRAFQRLGWTLNHSTGSHAILRKEGYPPLSIPCHQGKDVKRGLLAKQLQLGEITEDDYLAVFK